MGAEAKDGIVPPAESQPQVELTDEQVREALSQDASEGAEPGTAPEVGAAAVQPDDETAQGDESGASEDPKADDPAGDESASEQSEDAGAEDEAGEKSGKRNRGAEERIHELTEKLRGESAKASEFEQKWKSFEGVNASAIPLPLSYLTADEAKAIETANRLEGREQWLLQNIATGGTDPETGAELTTAQIGQELADMVPKRQAVAAVQKLYAEKHQQFMADAEAGRKARMAPKPNGMKQPVVPGPKQPMKKAAVVPGPKVSAPAPRAGGVPVTATQKSGGLNAKRFEINKQTMGEREAAVVELANL